MPAIPYCILLNDSAVSLPTKGIGNLGIHALGEGNLLALYSELERNAFSPQTFRQAALEFHGVVQAVFEQVAVVPFRFPTWLTPQELVKHLREQSQPYTMFLTDHASHVQMELRLTFPSRNPTASLAESGTAHLRARAAESRRVRSAGEGLKSLLLPEAIEWRERDTPEGLRLYALMERTHIAEFRERLSKREHEISVRWSGPWPAMEFLEPPRRSET